MAEDFDTNSQMLLYLEEKQKKQNFLIEKVASKGFDTSEFAQFLDTKKENGINIDNWTLEELAVIVVEFTKQAGDPDEESIEKGKSPEIKKENEGLFGKN